MRTVLALPFPGDRLHGAMGGVNDLLVEPRGDAYELRSVQRLWGSKEIVFLEPFLDLCASRYGAELVTLDFAGDPVGSRRKINFRIAEWTNQRIPELVPADLITADTILVLTNALYFRSPWESFFPEAATKPAPFRRADGDAEEVPMMERTGEYRHLATEDHQFLEIPYRFDELSMLVVLPRRVDGLADVEAALTPSTIAEWSRSAERTPVRLRLPRFRIESKFRLADILRSMGMESAFEAGRADFTGMTGGRDVCIDEVVHQAFVEVDEKGTEAAAATAVVAKRGALAAPEGEAVDFTADRPFLFAIRHNRTGAILFLGRLAEPVD
jgi:serpin B